MNAKEIAIHRQDASDPRPPLLGEAIRIPDQETLRMLYIPKIEHGIVVDHIPAGEGMKVLEILRTYPGMKDILITIGLNYQSTKLRRKDMLKLVIDDLAPEILEHLSLVSPGISIKRIRDYQVDKKFVITTPTDLQGKLQCSNPSCITNHERHLASHFRATRRDPSRYRCIFCERVFLLSELEICV